MENISLSWASAGTTKSKSYVCGYCGREISSEKGFNATCPKLGNTHVASIYICHACTRPTFFDAGGKQTPGVTFGDSIQDISDESVQALYDEARKATGSGCYSLAVLGCRKLLMHIAVSKGAKPGDSFLSYVQFFSDNNFIPPDAKEWVDHIRKKTNEANHEIVTMPKEDAEELLSFIAMLLKIIYEFPAKVRSKYKT